MKTYLKITYCEIIEILDVSDKITKYLKLNRLPHYTNVQKFCNNVRHKIKRFK